MPPHIPISSHLRERDREGGEEAAFSTVARERKSVLENPQPVHKYITPPPTYTSVLIQIYLHILKISKLLCCRPR